MYLKKKSINILVLRQKTCQKTKRINKTELLSFVLHFFVFLIKKGRKYKINHNVCIFYFKGQLVSN